MKRILLLALLLLGLTAAPARAATLPATVSCGHLHMAYSFTPGASSFPVSVTGSQCAAGSATGTAVTGSGTGSFANAPLNQFCPRGADIECLQFSLNLGIGGTTASPTFTTIGDVYPSVATGLPASTLAYAEADTITGFASGAGAGGFNTICTFANPTLSCTADGAFNWEPDA